MSDLPTLVAHLAWADARTRSSISTLDVTSSEYAESLRLYAHLAAAAHVWCSRIEGRTPAHVVWPTLTLDEAGALADESVAGLAACVARGAEELERTVSYTTSTGLSFQNTVAEMIRQVVTHGGYHRGQIAMLVRQGGGAPQATDYIVFVRL
ncbi:MAG: DinB family protein [Gemmatimonadaceae bacterium]|nr:DinB family protein [Gemmatimonadaceae bacterium]